jgi:xanthine dehydrogenase accessory factor
MREIIHQINEWRDADEAVAVATVVSTWGSAPRAVGAKMALTPSNKVAGSVSGGCVEGAVIEAGVETLDTGKPQLLQFGVADETAFEVVGLACGGSIAVFVEPLTPVLHNFWRDAIARDIPVVTATVIKGPPELVGYKLMRTADGVSHTSAQHERFNEVTPQLHTLAQFALSDGVSKRVDLPSPRAEVFLDVTLPKPTLALIGGVHIAIALTAMAKALGYRVVIIDPRSAFGNAERFPYADQIVAAYPDKAFDQVPITRSTAVVTLTHDAKFDDPALKIALPSPAFYVGALGGKKTQAARRERLLKAGLTEAQVNRLHAPIGLDIGTRTPEEIALATLAQIVAARNGRPGN